MVAKQKKQKEELTARLAKPLYTDGELAEIQMACAHIAEGMNDFTREEKRESYDFLNLMV